MIFNRKRIVTAGILAGCVLMLLLISRDDPFSDLLPSATGEHPHVTSDKNHHSPASTDQQTPGGNEVQPAGTQKSNGAGSGKKPEETYTSQNPVLMGLALGDSEKEVLRQHGEPIGKYVMDDGVSPISVYDYEEFSVGFDQKQKLEFVDVASPDTDPGLNGLKLGQHEDNAVKALGKPDTNTGYVLSYHTKSTVLKLDVDPKTKIIQSIKLFARTN